MIETYEKSPYGNILMYNFMNIFGARMDNIHRMRMKHDIK